MQKAAQAERTIHAVAKKFGCSELGIEWMDHALDPFKDILKPNAGYPDKNCNPSVIEVVKLDTTITAPGVANWDCNIFLDQMLQKVAQYSTTAYGSANGPAAFAGSGQGATPYLRGGLVWRTADAGVPLDITTTRGSLEVDPALYANEDCRVIAVGFEVHDMTQELKKQGALTVYRVDQTTEQPTPIALVQDQGVTACIPTTANFVRLTNPPSTSAQAVDLVGSQTWEAKEGAYVVPVMNCDTNPAMGLRGDYVSYSAETSGVFYAPKLVSTGAARLLTLDSASPIAQCPNPWSMSGIFITGLDPLAVMKVNLNFIIERFPNRSSSVKRLAYPSPKFDPATLELYSSIASSLPCGVPVKQNGFGDWIWGIAKIAGAALSAFPVTKAVGEAVKAAVTVRETLKKESDEKKEKKIEKAVEARVATKVLEKKNNKKTTDNGETKKKQQQKSVNLTSVPYPSMYVPMNPYVQAGKHGKKGQHLITYQNPQMLM